VIARVWSGATPVEKADAYVAHLRERTFPELTRIAGHRGASVLRRPSGHAVAFTVITLWESIDAIRAFAGDDVEAAVVPAEARALLSAYDARAVHWDVALSALDKPGAAGAK
jgi:heme-degrading monooxygenase HmoA